jgi:hypothetical protein
MEAGKNGGWIHVEVLKSDDFCGSNCSVVGVYARNM